MTYKNEDQEQDFLSLPIKTVDLMGSHYIASQHLATLLAIDAHQVRRALAKVATLKVSPGDSAVLTVAQPSKLGTEVFCNAAGLVASAQYLMVEQGRPFIKARLASILNALLRVDSDGNPLGPVGSECGESLDSEFVSPVKVLALRHDLAITHLEVVEQALAKANQRMAKLLDENEALSELLSKNTEAA